MFSPRKSKILFWQKVIGLPTRGHTHQTRVCRPLTFWLTRWQQLPCYQVLLIPSVLDVLLVEMWKKLKFLNEKKLIFSSFTRQTCCGGNLKKNENKNQILLKRFNELFFNICPHLVSNQGTIYSKSDTLTIIPLGLCYSY